MRTSFAIVHRARRGGSPGSRCSNRADGLGAPDGERVLQRVLRTQRNGCLRVVPPSHVACDRSAQAQAAQGENVVPEGGIEPPRPFGHGFLKPARLPIPPLWRRRAILGVAGRQVKPHGPTARRQSGTSAAAAGKDESETRRRTSYPDHLICRWRTRATGPTTIGSPARRTCATTSAVANSTLLAGQEATSRLGQVSKPPVSSECRRSEGLTSHRTVG